MIKQIEVLNSKKSGTFMNIPTQKLKDAKEEIAKPLTLIWNEEILGYNPSIQKAWSNLQAELQAC